MIESTPKVALLGRPGPAREHLRKALADLGGEITIEGEPGELVPSQVVASAPSVVVVSLDAAMEDKLEDWDELFEADGLNVIFDEAETTSQLDGWDLARWARHLAAKILGHDQTLPPVPEGAPPVQGAVDWIPSPGQLVTPAAHMDAERLEDYAAEALDHAEGVPVADAPQVDVGQSDDAGEDARAWAGDMEAAEAEEIELDDELAALIAQHDANAAVEGVGRFAGASLEEVSPGLEAPEDGSEVDLSAEFSDLDEQLQVDGEAAQEAAASYGSELDVDKSQVTEAQAEVVPDEPTADDSPRLSFGRKLELLLDDEPAGAESVAQPPASDSGTAAAMSFDELAAAFELEDVESADAGDPQPVRGLLLLLAGMGGPDALRQLLSALPPRIPVPVVVWQQLNAGTHDRLASQLSKTGKVETTLATAGEPLRPGMVYILPPGVGISCLEEPSFTEDAGGPETFLAALEPLGDAAVVVALSGAEPAWLADASRWASHGGQLFAQSPATCFEASACERLVGQGVADAAPADLAIRALGKWHEDI